MDKSLVYLTVRKEENWFYKKYFYNGANFRYPTFQVALNLLQQRFKNPVIIETGCQRQEYDLGSGMSTSIFAEYISRYGGSLISIDNNELHLNNAKTYANKWIKANCQFVHSDSVKWLKGYSGKCSLLYLDSYDYPYGTMLDMYGGRSDITTAEKRLRIKTEEEIMTEFGHIILPCQQHCLKEFKGIEAQLEDETILLVDDNMFPGGGKPKLLKDYLLDSNKWICLLDDQQTLWIRK